MRIIRIIGTGVLAAFMFGFAAVPDLLAVEVEVTTDTPWSFRASFTALDTDPNEVGGQFREFTFDFWSLLVHMRGDAVDQDGNAAGFYEIQLRRTGSKTSDPDAPIVKTFLFFDDLQPNVVLTDLSVSSQPNAGGSDYLSTTVNILFDSGADVVRFSGTVAGDIDLDGDGVMDSPETDVVAHTLKGLKDVGIITGKEMGQIIKQTRQPTKK